MEPNPPAAPAGESFGSFALTRPEYIGALVHFYRGAMYRSQIWNTRLDTSNCAVASTAGLISFAPSSPENSGFTLLLGNLLINTS